MANISGKTIAITGAARGIGYATAKALLGRGARVVIGDRDVALQESAVADLTKLGPVSGYPLDVTDRESFATFLDKARTDGGGHIDVLINNAGVMAIPYRKTADGFEMQIGTNHFGHFALTGLLLEPLLAATAARVVNVSSTAHKMGRMNFDDLQSVKGYSKWPAYAQSKLANLLFTYELQRRLEAAHRRAISVACQRIQICNVALARPSRYIAARVHVGIPA